MDWLFNVDWKTMLEADTPLLEIFLRGSMIYLGLFFMLRFILKRTAGTVGISDMLVVVLIADAAQNGMAADYHSVTDGLFLVATILFWSVLLDWLGFRFPRIRRLLEPPPLPLVEKGRILHRNLRRELITRDELMEQLREQGLERLDQVKRACMESDGHISVIPYQRGPEGKPRKQRGA
jgi:uncharacterized membrane protein YcaP (DUF421 family)